METETAQQHTTEEHAPGNGNSNGYDNAIRHNAAERKMVSRLQEAVDDRGRYSYRLKDLAIGYAAAQGCTEHAAKEKINDAFEREMGTTLQGYLEGHRAELGLPVDKSRTSGR